MEKKVILSLKQLDSCLDNLDFEPILKSRLRQVKWLFNNGNKCLKVYDEKLVRLMIHRLQARIKELEKVNL